MMASCLHGEEAIVFGDRGYHKKNRTLDDFEKEGDLSVLTPTKKPAGGALTEEQKAFNRMLSAVRAIVEHPFRVVKRQFGFVKVRYRGLAKNAGQIVTLFALTNLWLARKRLLPLVGEVCPFSMKCRGKPLYFMESGRKSSVFHVFYDSPRRNSAVSIRSAKPSPCTRALSGEIPTPRMSEMPSMPSSPTRPTSRLAQPSIGVTREMQLVVGKKTWRMRSPGSARTSANVSSTGLQVARKR